MSAMVKPSEKPKPSTKASLAAQIRYSGVKNSAGIMGVVNKGEFDFEWLVGHIASATRTNFE